ncbi:tyrosine-type recombinase/integrase [Natronobacterium texcoconense]|uniref:tyrosine-type recombinase/integrase n=1 Tax=Natronobacterium texcoconense TaxID=1095778 RepID=UPI001479858D|nr:site-specific integrase [Natronobacterium texcoconense]
MTRRDEQPRCVAAQNDVESSTVARSENKMSTPNSNNSESHQPNSSKEKPHTDTPHVPEPTQEYLGERQAMLYEKQRERFIEWLATEDACEGDGTLSEQSRSNYASRLDQIHRWVWRHETDGFVSTLTTDHADAFVEALDEDKFTKRTGEPYAADSKKKFVNALKKLFQWQSDGEDEPWEPETKFSQNEYDQFDPLTREERGRLREAATTFGSMPVYNDLSPEERSRKKALLAQRLGKPKDEVTMDDWKRQNQTWKFASLVMVALDAGLRPCEVERARTSWYQPGAKILSIPKEDAAKNRKYWEVALRDETTDALDLWLDERDACPKYDDTDKLWLNRKSNPYNSKTLNHLFRQLLEEAGIDDTNRKLTWYSIRHSLGTYMTQEGDLEQAREQMRHKSAESTQRYVHAPPETRRNTLDRME